MNKWKRLYAALICGVLLFGYSFVHAADTPAPHHNWILIHLTDNDPARWSLALNNAKNLQSALGKDNVKIEIVANGPGIQMLKFESELGNRLQDAADSGVLIAVCANSMKAYKLSMADMHPVVRQVPAGVAELLIKQQEGWAYIRP